MFASLHNQEHGKTSTAFARDEELAALCLRWWNIALVREKFRLSGIAERLQAQPDVESSMTDQVENIAVSPEPRQQVYASTGLVDDYE